MVRSEFMEHIPSIAIFCKQHSEDLGVVIRQQIVPYTVKLLTDNQIQVSLPFFLLFNFFQYRDCHMQLQ